MQSSGLKSYHIVSILEGVVNALNYLHSVTPGLIIYRDVSTSNVLLNPLPNDQWHPKLGCVNYRRACNTLNPGNPMYAAPEALIQSAPQGPAMDVYRFGVLMFDMCSREFPTQRLTPSLMHKVNWRAPESRLVNVIMHCVSKDIKGRSTMQQLVKHFKKFTW